MSTLKKAMSLYMVVQVIVLINANYIYLFCVFLPLFRAHYSLISYLIHIVFKAQLRRTCLP